jgi:hypothetical protein
MENWKEWCIISRLFEQVLGGLRKLGENDQSELIWI